MITTIQSFQRVCLLLLGVAFISLAGCNKEEESFMATEVRLTGFNNTGEELEIQIDSIIYKNSRYYEKPTSFYPDEYIPFSFAYLYYSADNPVLTLKGKTTGKIYLEQPIKKGVLRQRYGFTYVNGENVYNKRRENGSCQGFKTFSVEVCGLHTPKHVCQPRYL